MPEPTDQIALELPLDRALIGVARLVVGGLGARLDLPFEALDDLQLVVETVLDAETTATHSGGSSGIRLVARVTETSVAIELFPIESNLTHRPVGAAAAGLSLDQICSSLVDRHRIVEESGSRRLLLEKTIPTPAPSQRP